MGNNIYTALDIGSSKISCAIFEIISKGEDIKLLGTSIKSSAGIRSGVVDNITEATATISHAIYEAEKQAGTSSKKVIVNVSHPFISSRLAITDSQFGGRQILPKTLKDIADKVLYSAHQSKHSVLHFAPAYYDVDTIKNVAEPEYMFASNLRSYHSIISVPVKTLDPLKRCLRDLHLIPIQFVASSYASSFSLALEGVQNFISIDIGDGTSDVAVFGNSSAILWAGTVPIGGEAITRDIMECFSISYEEAEKMKILYGNLSQNQTEKSSPTIDVSLLNNIISARLEEILEIIFSRIPEEYHMQTIFLTGGVAKTLGIVEFISRKFDVRANLIIAPNLDDKLRDDPALSTTNGLITHYLKESTRKQSFSAKQVLEWLWENF
jgi:cell division protein FtsA